jgi:hypothetical protein
MQQQATDTNSKLRWCVTCWDVQHMLINGYRIEGKKNSVHSFEIMYSQGRAQPFHMDLWIWNMQRRHLEPHNQSMVLIGVVGTFRPTAKIHLQPGTPRISLARLRFILWSSAVDVATYYRKWLGNQRFWWENCTVLQPRYKYPKMVGAKIRATDWKDCW